MTKNARRKKGANNAEHGRNCDHGRGDEVKTTQAAGEQGATMRSTTTPHSSKKTDGDAMVLEHELERAGSAAALESARGRRRDGRRATSRQRAGLGGVDEVHRLRPAGGDGGVAGDGGRTGAAADGARARRRGGGRRARRADERPTEHGACQVTAGDEYVATAGHW